MSPNSRGRHRAGGHPQALVRTPLPPSFQPPGAGLSFGLGAHGPSAPNVAAVWSRGTVRGGGGGHWRRWSGSVVSGQWSADQ